MADNALAMTIEVLEGPRRTQTLQEGRPPGTLHLTGRLLPFRPEHGGTVRYARKQRVKTTFYPGNPAASQQVMGSTLEPSTFKGMWRDSSLGEGAAITLAALFDDLCASGASVRVTWGTQGASSGGGFLVVGQPFVRVGIMSAFEANPDRVGDIGWSMTFDWRADGAAAASAVPIVAATGLVNPSDDLEAVASELDLATATWEAAQDGPLLRPAGVAQRIADGMDQAFAATDAAAAAIRDVSGRAAGALLTPARVSGQLQGAAAGAIDALGNAVSLALSVNLLVNEARDSATDTLLLLEQRLAMIAVWDSAAERCRDAQDAAAAQAQPEVLAEVQAPAGTDLRDLALRFYGDPDAWFQIAAYNNLPGSSVPAVPTGPSDVVVATSILIPRAAQTSTGDVRQQC